MRQQLGSLKPGTSFRTILTGREGTVLGDIAKYPNSNIGVLVVLDPGPGRSELEERTLHPSVVVDVSARLM